MPTYQYACTECGEPLEVVQSFTDDALTECPSCGGRLRKRFNAVGIVFKGSGFYRTDSRSGSSSSDAAATTSGAAATGSEKGSKSDAGSGSKESAAKSDGASGGDKKATAPAASPSGGSGTSAA